MAASIQQFESYQKPAAQQQKHAFSPHNQAMIGVVRVLWPMLLSSDQRSCVQERPFATTLLSAHPVYIYTAVFRVTCDRSRDITRKRKHVLDIHWTVKPGKTVSTTLRYGKTSAAVETEAYARKENQSYPCASRLPTQDGFLRLSTVFYTQSRRYSQGRLCVCFDQPGALV